MNATSFPYSVHDEPTDDWTIEELLHWCLLQSQHKTISKRDEIINAFQELFDIGKQEILELQNEICRLHQDREYVQEEAQPGVEREEGVGHGNCDIDDNGMNKRQGDTNRTVQGIQNDENQHPNTDSGNGEKDNNNRNGGIVDDTKPAVLKKKNISTSTSTSPSSSKSTTKPTTIKIEIIKGPHMGCKYNLKPQYKKPCWVGRSSSKKFRDRGISLNKDQEVSTTHGKFHIHPSGSNGKLVFTDTGSTNGSIYNDVEIEDNVPLELVDGMVLILGNSDLLIHLI